MPKRLAAGATRCPRSLLMLATHTSRGSFSLHALLPVHSLPTLLSADVALTAHAARRCPCCFARLLPMLLVAYVAPYPSRCHRSLPHSQSLLSMLDAHAAQRACSRFSLNNLTAILADRGLLPRLAGRHARCSCYSPPCYTVTAHARCHASRCPSSPIARPTLSNATLLLSALAA